MSYFIQLLETVNEYKLQIEKLSNECEDLRIKEKQLIQEMKRKGDLARQMLMEKDVKIQQLYEQQQQQGCDNSDHMNKSVLGKSTKQHLHTNENMGMISSNTNDSNTNNAVNDTVFNSKAAESIKNVHDDTKQVRNRIIG